jgi:hypothetical protein
MKKEYPMPENPQPLTKDPIAAIQNNAKRIGNIAAEINKATHIPVTPLGIASPVAREMNKDEIDRFQSISVFAGRDDAVRCRARDQ